ncbi:MAG: Competence protein ComM [Arcobacter lacus]|nr:MAG: Competence protein ComM [Arcobacter lacus]
MQIIKSATLDEIEAVSVNVESTFTKGLPSFSIIGMVSTSISESKDRVKSALLLNEYKFPPLKITVNLSPSEIKKNGTQFDLAIALQIALYEEKRISLDDIYVFGELGLDGIVKENDFIFPIVLSLAKQKIISEVLVCKETANKIEKIPNLKIYVVNTLDEAINFFKSSDKEKYIHQKQEYEYKKINIRNKDYYYLEDYSDDYSEVIGQDIAKFASLISLCGNHNLILTGSPGCGKSMIINRMQHLQAPMSLEEILEKAKLQSLEGKVVDFVPKRAFKAVHCSSTKSSIFGGGSSRAKIGEIALCNGGMMFFDELPHFPKSVLESLREPLQDNKIQISRVNSKVLYNTNITFVAAQNPCPCGNLLSSLKECRCSEIEIQRYKNKISEPILDRIDLYVTMNDTFNDNKNVVSSKELHKTVLKTFSIQKSRGQSQLNGKLSDSEVKEFCVLEDDCIEVFNRAKRNYQLSFRSVNKVLKVARTIADINGKDKITKKDLLQSLSYRRR